MTSYSELILRSYEDRTPIRNEAFRDITFPQAVATQQNVLEARGSAPGGFKVILRSNDSRWVVAPMAGQACIRDGQTLRLPGFGLIGFEVELAFVLKHDITPQMAQRGIEGVMAAVDHAVFGLEILQTRFDDRDAAGLNAQFADNLNNGGYVLGPQTWTGDPNVGGQELHVTVNGETVFDGAANHPFGHPLQPVVEFALSGSDPLGALKAGSLVTTGALCGVIPLGARSRISVTVAGTYHLDAEVISG